MRVLFSGLLFLTVAFAASDFLDSCSILWIAQGGSDVELGANCEDTSGALHFSSLPLNGCFGNKNGAVDCGSTNFGNTCSGCHLDGVEMLKCTCLTISGGKNDSSSSLNRCVGNDNGHLYCDGHPF